MHQQSSSHRFLAGAATAIALLLTLAIGSSSAVAGADYCRGKLRKSEECAGSGGRNQPPTISGVPPTEVTTGQTYSFTPTASDPEGKTLSFSIVNRPPWASFSSSTGRLSGTPASSAAGEYIDIVISVSDGKSTAKLAPFAIVVNQSNRAPTIGGTPPTTAREGQVYEFRPTATDADGDPLTFGITNRPAWATFSSSTGTLKGTPGTGTVGTYADIRIRVSDGNLTASLPAFAIAVQQSSLFSATLSWQAPTQRTDGTALTNLAGYRIRYGTSAGSYPNVVTVANAGVTTYVIGNLPAGTYYFVVTAYDTNGIESDLSGVASKTVG